MILVCFRVQRDVKREAEKKGEGWMMHMYEIFLFIVSVKHYLLCPVQFQLPSDKSDRLAPLSQLPTAASGLLTV